MPKLDNKGILAVPVLIGVFILGVAGFVGYNYIQSSSNDVLQMQGQGNAANSNFKIRPCPTTAPSPEKGEAGGPDAYGTNRDQPCFYNNVDKAGTRNTLVELINVRNSYLNTLASNTTTPNSTTPNNQPRRGVNYDYNISPNAPELFQKFNPKSATVGTGKAYFFQYPAPAPKSGSNVKPVSTRGCLDFIPNGVKRPAIQTITSEVHGGVARFLVYTDVEAYLRDSKEAQKVTIVQQLSGPILANRDGGRRLCGNTIVIPSDKKVDLFFYMKGYVPPKFDTLTVRPTISVSTTNISGSTDRNFNFIIRGDDTSVNFFKDAIEKNGVQLKTTNNNAKPTVVKPNFACGDLKTVGCRFSIRLTCNTTGIVLDTVSEKGTRAVYSPLVNGWRPSADRSEINISGSWCPGTGGTGGGSSRPTRPTNAPGINCQDPNNRDVSPCKDQIFYDYCSKNKVDPNCKTLYCRLNPSDSYCSGSTNQSGAGNSGGNTGGSGNTGGNSGGFGTTVPSGSGNQNAECKVEERKFTSRSNCASGSQGKDLSLWCDTTENRMYLVSGCSTAKRDAKCKELGGCNDFKIIRQTKKVCPNPNKAECRL